jgi:diguanylate cyclase (GGDEF)-like protein/PAS domain S-box-containing protein
LSANAKQESTTKPERRKPKVATDFHVTRVGNNNVLKLYIKSFVLATLVIVPAFVIQIIGVLEQDLFDGNTFRLQLLFMPIAVITVLGLLIGRVLELTRKLHLSSDKFRAVADEAEDFIYLRTIQGEYEYVSPACEAMLGYTPDEFYARSNLMNDLVHPDDRERWLHHVDHVNHAGAAETLDIRLLGKSGRLVWVSHVCSPVYDGEGNQIGVRATNVDITERKAFEDRIEHMAYYDPLSDLPNRRSLERTIRQYIRSSSGDKELFAVLFLDLDRFKYINDSYGHFLGDKLLRLIAKRLITHSNEGVVTRFGGDEFVILAHHINNREEAIEFAERLIDAIEEPFEAEGHELYLTGSIGISFYPYDGTTADELVKHADAAMYRSKQGRQEKIKFFSPDMTRQATAFVSTESNIRRGLEQGEFEIYYQPKVQVSDGAIVGLEALARWNHPDQGLLLPKEFIPIAEETGLILPLGQQLIGQVLSNMSAWHGRHLSLPVAINISGRQFLDSKFCDSTEAQILASGVDPSKIELEITEQVFMSDLEGTVTKLGRLKRHGIKVAIDDFGTGYSSLKYIKSLPIDTVKIDRFFIWGATEDSKDMVVLKAITSLCHGLGLNMVAEGIETDAHLRLIADLGCPHVQGFLFHKPMAFADIDRLLSDKSAVASE